MLKLIIIAGIWINPVQITYLNDFKDGCMISFTAQRNKYVSMSCTEVAKTINEEYQK